MARKLGVRWFGVALAFLLLPALSLAQAKPEPKAVPEPKAAAEPSPTPNLGHVDPAGWVTEVFKLKFAQPEDLVDVLHMFSGRANRERDLRVVMWSGPNELLPAVREIVARLDVAPVPVPSVDLTFYLLSGSAKGDPAAALPSELEGVATQVKGLFGLSRLSLLETALIRVRDGSGGTAEGVVPSFGDPRHPAEYRLAFDRASLSADERGKTVHLSRFSLMVNVPFGERSAGGTLADVVYKASTLRTDAEVREGQKVVLGKASVDRSGDTLFLVVTAKVVD